METILRTEEMSVLVEMKELIKQLDEEGQKEMGYLIKGIAIGAKMRAQNQA